MILTELASSRSAESWIGVSGFLISCAMRRATSAQTDVALGGQELGDVVERDDVAGGVIDARSVVTRTLSSATGRHASA